MNDACCDSHASPRATIPTVPLPLGHMWLFLGVHERRRSQQAFTQSIYCMPRPRAHILRLDVSIWNTQILCGPRIKSENSVLSPQFHRLLLST